MADTKVSALTELTAPAADDELVVVDKSDTTMAASGTNKRIKFQSLERIVLKTADETVNNSATLQNDNELFFSIAANELIYFELIARVVGVSVNADIRFNWSLPAGATVAEQAGWATQGTSTTGNQGVLLTNVFMGLASGDCPLRVYGWIQASSTAGTATLQWCQATLTAEDVTLKAGSHLVLRKL